MAKLTVMSNRINEIQEKNMKMYPFVFFDGVRNVSIDYDLSNKAMVDEKDPGKLHVKTPQVNHYVKYMLTIAPDVTNSNMDRRFSAIESAIKSLFWKNVIVLIYINDKLAFESKKNG